MKVRKFRIIVVFTDNDCERFTTSEFYFKDNVLTIMDGYLKRTLKADYIKEITIF